MKLTEKIGVSILVLGLIGLIIFPVYMAIVDPEAPWIIKIGLPMLAIGFTLVLLSVLIDRIKEDDEEVERA